MTILRGLGVMALLSSGACRVKPRESSPQESTFCSNAYPYGIAQEEREQRPPTFRVAVEQPFVDVGSALPHLFYGMNDAAGWSGTTFENAYSETPHLIMRLDTMASGEDWTLSAMIQGREDLHASSPPDEPQEARVLFTASFGPLDSTVTLLETAGAEIAQYITEGWTCEGDSPKHARRFGE